MNRSELFLEKSRFVTTSLAKAQINALTNWVHDKGSEWAYRVVDVRHPIILIALNRYQRVIARMSAAPGYVPNSMRHRYISHIA